MGQPKPEDQDPNKLPFGWGTEELKKSEKPVKPEKPEDDPKEEEKEPDPLPPSLEAGARAAMAERPPHEAEPPIDELAEAPFPKLVVSGAHNPALDSVADVLEERLRAQRVVLPGSGHTIQRLPQFNVVLARFLEAA